MFISTFKTYVVTIVGLGFSISNFFINEIAQGSNRSLYKQMDWALNFAFWTGTFCPFSFIYFKFEEYLENEVY